MTYTFKSESMDKSPCGSKICNIIVGFADYGNQLAITYGKIRARFGEPLYETKIWKIFFPIAFRPHRRMELSFIWTFTAPVQVPPSAEGMTRFPKRPPRNLRPISNRLTRWIIRANAIIWMAPPCWISV